MMKKVTPAILIFMMLLMIVSQGAATINGGRGLVHTKAAWVQERGRLTLLSQSRFWGKVYQHDTKIQGVSTATTLWNVQGQLSVNYGMGSHIDLTVTPIFYQDAHRGSYEEYPWDTFIGLKFGSYGSKASSLNYGVQLAARFPTGEKHNINYENYTAGTVEVGFHALASYATDPLYPEDALNVHANLGYWHHNDVGETLVSQTIPEAVVLHPSQQLKYAIGFSIPTESFDYGLELYGNFWLRQPPLTAASRENFAYLNANVTYKPYRWFDFIVSGEYRLTADNEETIGPRRSLPTIPNYNTWRISMGGKFTLLPTSVFRTSERDILMQKATNRRELFEQIIRERRETESAEEELDRIREERRKAERELERLRRILEGQNELDNMRQDLNPNE
jgi:hypothetical protein